MDNLICSNMRIILNRIFIVFLIFHSGSVLSVGEADWSFGFDVNGLSVPTIGNDGTIYVSMGTAYSSNTRLTTDSYLYARNSDGTFKWTYKASDINSIGVPLVTSSGQLILVMRGGSGANVGTLRLRRITSSTPDDGFDWEYIVSGTTVSSDAAIDSNGNVYFATGYPNNKLISLSSNGVFRWEYVYATAGSAFAPVIGADGNVFLSAGNEIIALTNNGGFLWRKTLNGYSKSPVLDVHGNIYVSTDQGFLYVYRPDGSLKWNFRRDGVTDNREVLRPPVIAANGMIYVTTRPFTYGGSAAASYKNIYAIYPNGQLNWMYNNGVGVSYLTLAQDNTIYVMNGNVTALNADKSIKWVSTSGVAGSLALHPDGSFILSSNDSFYSSTQDSSFLLKVVGESAQLMDAPWPTHSQNLSRTRLSPKIEVPDAPVVTLVSPSAGNTFNTTDSIEFSVLATDAEDGNISANVLWQSNIDGSLGTGAVLIRTLTPGQHNITASATNGNAVTSIGSVSIAINSLPVLSNITPVLNSTSIEDNTVILNISASDQEDGDISAQVVWTSDIEGLLGTGAPLSYKPIVGRHTITATITDANGAATTLKTNIQVSPWWDTDNDQLPDTWEMLNFGSLIEIGTGDFDSDGINNLQDYRNQLSLPTITGDINSDGNVNVADLLLATRHIHQYIELTPSQISSADLFPANAPNGLFNIQDLLLLQQKVLIGDSKAGKPEIIIIDPYYGQTVNQSNYTVSGFVDESLSSFKINGLDVTLSPGNIFNEFVTLQEGQNVILISGTDKDGNTVTLSHLVNLDSIAPDRFNLNNTIIVEGANSVSIEGLAASVEPGSNVALVNQRTGETVNVTGTISGAFTTALLTSMPEDTVLITVTDVAGNVSPSVSLQVGLPFNPADIAPELSKTKTTPFIDQISFLYSGSRPIQQGVLPNIIDSRTVSVLRGRVEGTDNTPISGVKVSVLNRPEFGYTYTRSDGLFDMAINGGGINIIVYEKNNYLTVQRDATSGWRDYSSSEDIILTQLDVPTAVDLTSAVDFQVASASIETDANGTRQARVLFPQGTTATAQLPGGATQALTNLTVRSTEYTVGGNGVNAMPGTLPPSSGYTYAVELSIDEAVQLGATRVDFNQAIPFYVENFLGFPTGMSVPTGYYDRNAGKWIASDNGRVVEILSISTGVAQLDIDGTGLVADAASLSLLGITIQEQRQIASLYSVGESIWRSPISHFTPYDLNWPKAIPKDAKKHDVKFPEQYGAGNKDDNDCFNGCIIEAEKQSLGEVIDIAGSEFTLNYASSRMPGSLNSISLDIPLTGDVDSMPTSLKAVKLEIFIAGVLIRTMNNSPVPNQIVKFVWDGLDAYGRPVAGKQKANIKIGYVYDFNYRSPDDLLRAFGVFGKETISVNQNIPEAGTTLWTRYERMLGSANYHNFSSGLGGFTLDIHHAYNPVAKELYLGSGGRRSEDSLYDNVSNVVGAYGLKPVNNAEGAPADESPAIDARSIATASDGTIYYPGIGGLKKVTPEGLLVTVAGLANVRDMDIDGAGNIYVTQYHPEYKIKKIDPDGIITTVAGTGAFGNAQFIDLNGLVATETTFNALDIAVAPDGTIYFNSGGGNTGVTKFNKVGVIHTNGLMSEFRLTLEESPGVFVDVAVGELEFGKDGNLYNARDYYTDFPASAECAIYKVSTTSDLGNVEVVAGARRVCGQSGDGGQATDALIAPESYAVDKFGAIYLTNRGVSISEKSVLRKISTDGVIETLIGNGDRVISRTDGFGIEEAAASTSVIFDVDHVAVDEEGNVLFTEGSHGILRVGASAPKFSTEGYKLPSSSGKQLFIFDITGRHLRTIDTITGKALYTFNYDQFGYLEKITDIDGLVTTIDRSNNVATITAPYGIETRLYADVNGYAERIENPENENHQFVFSEFGLLQQYTDQNSNTSNYLYTADGLFYDDTQQGGGGWTIDKTQLGDVTTTTMTSKQGRVTTIASNEIDTGHRIVTTTKPNNEITQIESNNDASEIVTQASGTVITTEKKADPRFGFVAAYPSNITIATPSGLTSELSSNKEVVGSVEPLNVSSATNTITLNGQATTEVYTSVDNTWLTTSPLNRLSRRVINDDGRTMLQQVAGFLPVNYTYNSKGNLETIITGTGSASRITRFTYNTKGFLQTIINPLNEGTRFDQYDKVGRVKKQIQPNLSEILYDYDNKGNLTGITPPGKPVHGFSYTSDDQENIYTPPNLPGVVNPVTDSDYSIDQDLERITRPDGKVVDPVYSASTGELQNIIIPRGSYSYTYKPTTRQLDTITTPDANVLTYSYDGHLNKGTSWSGEITGSVTKNYNNNFQVQDRSINASNIINFLYDDDGLLTDAGLLNFARNPAHGFIDNSTLGSVTTNRAYNGFAELETYSAQYTTSTLYNAAYDKRDKLGRIETVTENIESDLNQYEYAYDINGRLERVTKNLISTIYGYDNNGNRTHVNGIQIATYDDQDRLNQFNTTGYTYTDNGDLLTKTTAGITTTFNYDVLGNLMQVSLPGSLTLDYIIDGENRRIGKKVNGALVQGFLYKDLLNPIAELDSSNTVISRFIYADKANVPAYMIKGGNTYRIISDHLGSPRLVIDIADGTVVQRMDYDVWGNVTNDTNPGFQPFGFAGGIYDQHTKLTRFGARDYDAEVGRWTVKDPIGFRGGQSNLYVYVNNNPINLTDPLGLYPPSWLTQSQRDRASSTISSLTGGQFTDGQITLLTDTVVSEAWPLDIAALDAIDDTKSPLEINQNQNTRITDLLNAALKNKKNIKNKDLIQDAIDAFLKAKSSGKCKIIEGCGGGCDDFD